MDNLLSKLSRLHVEEKRFTPDGSKDPIVYNVAVLSIQLNGKPPTIELKISNDTFRVFYFCSSYPSPTFPRQLFPIEG